VQCLSHRPIVTGALLAALAFTGACDTDRLSRDTAQRALALPPAPPDHRPGEAAFALHCESCHGPRGTGTGEGPPLLHPFYVPSHHGDEAFTLAVRNGVRAHHWRFGDMPPQPQVADEEVARIVGYVRWLQREVGLY
jgi:mono/diheme cytochrome c family protein